MWNISAQNISFYGSWRSSKLSNVLDKIPGLSEKQNNTPAPPWIPLNLNVNSYSWNSRKMLQSKHFQYSNIKWMFLELTMSISFFLFACLIMFLLEGKHRDEFKNNKIIWFCWTFPILWVARKEVVITSVNCVSWSKIKAARTTLNSFAVILASFNSEIH